MKTFLNAGAISLVGILMAACATSANNAASTNAAPIPEAVSSKTETAPATKTAEAVDPNKKVCKMSLQSHTRFKKRTCMTQAQWDAQAEAAQRDAAEVQRRGSIQKKKSN